MAGSPFNVTTGTAPGMSYTYLDIAHSCMGAYGGDLVLTGGGSHHYCTRCSLRVGGIQTSCK